MDFPDTGCIRQLYGYTTAFGTYWFKTWRRGYYLLLGLAALLF